MSTSEFDGRLFLFPLLSFTRNDGTKCRFSKFECNQTRYESAKKRHPLMYCHQPVPVTKVRVDFSLRLGWLQVRCSFPSVKCIGQVRVFVFDQLLVQHLLEFILQSCYIRVNEICLAVQIILSGLSCLLAWVASIRCFYTKVSHQSRGAF